MSRRTSALSVRHLAKTFGSFRAVQGISFDVPRGAIVGLLGPNGAGKTTTISMLLGLIEPDRGSIRYFGREFADNRQASLARLNFTSAFNWLQGRLTVRENLSVFAELYSVVSPTQRIDQLSEQFSLGPLLNQRYWDLSAGQQTRVNVAKSLLNEPELILMDEPTASLDPDIADTVLSFIEQQRTERHVSVLFTSHNMAEITRLCDDVVFLDRGSVVVHDTPLGLTKRITTATLTLTFDATQARVRSFLRGRSVPFTFLRPNVVSITTDEATIPALIFGLSEADVWITDIDVAKPTLEDVFLEIARRPQEQP
jgi:ABC-2 type transport system ATP-binding protein